MFSLGWSIPCNAVMGDNLNAFLTFEVELVNPVNP